MFERFTDRARHAVVLSQEEARLLNHAYIGTEHVLLGLIHDGEGVAAKSLENLGVTLEKVRALVEEIIGLGGQSPTGHIPFTPRAKKVIELSLREALQLGHNYIGTEHILLAVVREGEGVAMKVLTKLGVNEGMVRDMVRKTINMDPPSPTSTTIVTEASIVTRVQSTETVHKVLRRATEIADGKDMDLRHLKQALQELDDT